MSSYRALRRNRPPYLLDTHVWIWYVQGEPRLDRRVRAALDEEADELWLSPISVWEFGLLNRRGRYRAFESVRSWVRDALEGIPLQHAALTNEVALRSNEIDLPHADPADRFLAATALVYELTLVTEDRYLVAADWLPTLSG